MFILINIKIIFFIFSPSVLTVSLVKFLVSGWVRSEWGWRSSWGRWGAGTSFLTKRCQIQCPPSHSVHYISPVVYTHTSNKAEQFKHTHTSSDTLSLCPCHLSLTLSVYTGLYLASVAVSVNQWRCLWHVFSSTHCLSSKIKRFTSPPYNTNICDN